MVTTISLAERWEEVSCILCGPGSKTKMFWQDAEYGNIIRCTQCGLAYRSPRRPEDYLSRYFAEEWTESLALVKARTYIFRKILKWIIPHHNLRQEAKEFIYNKNIKKEVPPPLNESLRMDLIRLYRPHNEKLGKMINRDLSHWNHPPLVVPASPNST